MRKPNSFTQIDNLQKKRYDKNKASKQHVGSSQRNLSIDSNSNSDKSNVMMPKLSNSDVGSYYNNDFNEFRYFMY